MKPIVIIPARYGSLRFPGKPLAIIQDKPMIQHVYENAQKAYPDVWVATDDVRIEQKILQFKGKCIMTPVNCLSGTDRLAQAIRKIPEAKTFDVVVNVQGDEPFIQPSQIKDLVHVFEQNTSTQIATLAKKIVSFQDLLNPNKPKVVVSEKGHAIYFSRLPIPYLRDCKDQKEWVKRNTYYKHVGIYAYKREVLLEIAELPQSQLEKAENLEQLRWIENNYRINVVETNYESPSIDTIEDLENII